MKQQEFNTLLENFPSIEVELNSCHTEGDLCLTDYALEVDKYQIDLSCSIYETGIFDQGDFYTDPCFSSNGIEVEEIEFCLSTLDGEIVSLNPDQIEIIKAYIENNITTI